jgi:hypothetical protein
MTLNEFFSEMRKIDGWFLHYASIRRINVHGGFDCPLVAVGFKNTSPKPLHGWTEAAKKLRISRQRQAIMSAADNVPGAKLRQRMLRAARLANGPAKNVSKNS